MSTTINFVTKHKEIFFIAEERWCQYAWIHQYINRTFRGYIVCDFACFSTSMCFYWRACNLQT